MVYINKQGYLERHTRGGQKNPNSKGTTRAWWFIKARSERKANYCGYVFLAFPREYVGKKVRFKIEFVEDGTQR